MTWVKKESILTIIFKAKFQIYDMNANLIKIIGQKKFDVFPKR